MSTRDKETAIEDTREEAARVEAGNPEWLALLARTGPDRSNSLTIGSLIGIDPSGEPLVTFPGDAVRTGIAARSCVSLSADYLGRDVVLLFTEGSTSRPIVMGVLQSFPVQPSSRDPLSGSEPAARFHFEVDGERLVITADKEIVLRCGEASITLSRAGKILLRGTYLSSRSSGVNRIKGGSVEIN